jgi:5-methylcytosine-specific restriction endonuclease McrA
MPTSTLVLDSGFQPINVVPWQRAMAYILRDRCDVVEEYDAVVHADVQMPAVVRLNHSISRGRQKVKFSRSNVLMRDRGRCQYCGHKVPASDLTFDHVVPRCQGGKTEWTNIVMACYSCNQAKAHRTPAQADMRLLRQPVRPSWIPSYNARLKLKDVPKEWQDYWVVELEH